MPNSHTGIVIDFSELPDDVESIMEAEVTLMRRICQSIYDLLEEKGQALLTQQGDEHDRR